MRESFFLAFQILSLHSLSEHFLFLFQCFFLSFLSLMLSSHPTPTLSPTRARPRAWVLLCPRVLEVRLAGPRGGGSASPVPVPRSLLGAEPDPGWAVGFALRTSDGVTLSTHLCRKHGLGPFLTSTYRAQTACQALGLAQGRRVKLTLESLVQAPCFGRADGNGTVFS